MMKIGILSGFIFLVAVLMTGSIVWASAPVAVWANPDQCNPLPAPNGNIVNVSDEAGLWSAVNTAQPGDTILLADGTYNLGQAGYNVWIDTPNLTLRAASGNREDVILDDNWSASETISILASNVTIADITIRRARTHPIHVMSSEDADTHDIVIYNVHIIDPGQQAIKINPLLPGYTINDGVIACSHIELTDSGRSKVPEITPDLPCYTGGIDAHAAQGWVIRDNLIEGFWCSNGGLAEHGIHFWRDSRDTLVERNQLVDDARGIGFGLGSSGHVRGIIRNNMVHTIQDVGIGLESAPDTRVYHNSVYAGNYPNAIEYRFSTTSGVEIINNLTNGAIASRDGGTASLQSNLTSAQANWFVDAPGGDLHLALKIPGVVDGAQPLAAVRDDFDGDIRPIGSAPDIGADEYGDPPPQAVTDLRVAHAMEGTGVITITLVWTPPLGAQSQVIRYAHDPITASSWEDAARLTDSLTGSASSFTASIPSADGRFYFAHKSFNTIGDWSALSNNASWPRFDVYLPIIAR